MNKNTNTKRRLIIFFALVFFTAGSSLAQQNAFTYTQYADNLTPLNSAYSVVDKAGSISLLGRKQFVGIQGAPTTFLFNGNFPLENINSAVGLSVLNDQFAVEHQTEINAYFAKAIQLEANGYLAVSLNAGIRNYSANFSSLDPTDPSFRDDVRQTKPNLGFGVMYFTDTYYIGLSVPELTITNLGTASVLYQQITGPDPVILLKKILIELGHPIKSLGTHDVEVRLHREVAAHIQVEVVPEGKESIEVAPPPPAVVAPAAASEETEA